MNKEFADALEEFLSSEINDYGLTYTWKYDEDIECVIATIKRAKDETEIDVYFRYKCLKLEIQMGADGGRERVLYYDRTVKYFWMLIAPVFFK